MDYIREFIKHNINTNEYYTPIKELYDKAEDKEYFVGRIIKCFENFNAYYSVYTIMDSIIAFMEQHEDIRDMDDIIYHEEFDLIEDF